MSSIAGYVYERRDAVTASLGVPLVAGVFTDGWAHFNRPGLETFFTPWHAVLYSSLGVMSAWLAWVAWVAWVAWRGTVGDVRALDSLPRGYGLAVVGAVVFAAGGLGDMLWHVVFGIEIAVDALVSPTHLMLGAGGLMILSTPMRAQGLLSSSADGRWTVPARVSLVLALSLTVFFLLYVSAFAQPGPVERFVPTPENAPGHHEAELPVVASLAAYLMTTVVFTIPVLFVQRDGTRVPRGVVSLVVAAVALLPVVVMGLPPGALGGALGAVVAAVIWEVGYALASPRLSTTILAWAAPATLALAVWAGHLAGLAGVDALRWPVSLWTGVVVLAALIAGVLGFAASTPATSSTIGLNERTHA